MQCRSFPLRPRQSKKYKIRFKTTERAMSVGKYCDYISPLKLKALNRSLIGVKVH